jgi:hypothetical protein
VKFGDVPDRGCTVAVCQARVRSGWPPLPLAPSPVLLAVAAAAAVAAVAAPAEAEAEARPTTIDAPSRKVSVAIPVDRAHVNDTRQR